METLIAIALILIAAAVVVATTRAPRAGSAEFASIQQELRAVAARLDSDSSHLSARLEGIDSRMTQTQSSGQDLARGIFESLGDVKRATETVAEQARTFSSLQDILSAPKPRGGLGEALLEELLRQVLPPGAYEMQHRFADGRVVDAVVRAGGRLVCIDSKFPLSNYQRMCTAEGESATSEARRAFGRDVRKHITDIAARYIVPEEGTLDLAVMYVPAEGVYSEVLRLEHADSQLFDIAIEHRVIPMSPLTMYAYLQTLLLGLRYLKIESSAEAVLRGCEQLQRDVTRFASEYDTLGRHLHNASGKYEEGVRRLDRLSRSIEASVAVSETGSEMPPLRSVEAGSESAKKDSHSG